MMSWSFDNTKPIYLQIMEKIKLQIVSHELEPNQQLPTVRDLASEAGVNPNTIQRALSDLEREGFVYSKRTTGRFVTEDLDLILQSRKQLSEEQLQHFVSCMLQFGYQKEELPNVLSDYIKGV
jgi:lexA DNA binding domain